jgi:hypothetical protein
MFNVTYYEQSNNAVDVKVDAIQFLHLLELCASGRYIRAMEADFQGKSIDCNKLLRSLKFV